MRAGAPSASMQLALCQSLLLALTAADQPQSERFRESKTDMEWEVGIGRCIPPGIPLPAVCIVL